ncbi:N-(5'-phosphoribosyl)anthranilate isomerase [Wickerhamiella sorbophila]|uniref:N-(5'-phosphoribosyl)anthranilate isomerase n=1 Tax=Wickerhamiella sorbophila TaxID=45607 RepID=A0A2T0FPL0_9ASCO|nr:N-(5'-phosphoribosyl)anthranilate isomerase [Wickerhamiella sorbophila]PRT56924.1 N-(5'-phosphoribosyl)anthranilate isomerase [Wickerhamiella sorbophila]
MVIVKICGVRRPQDAKIALENGANLIGIILVPDRKRTVDIQTAKAIAKVVHEFNRAPINIPEPEEETLWEQRARLLEIASHSNPMLVGVVQNQSLDDVLSLQREIGLDIVQFHGDEPLSWCREVPARTFKRFTPNTENFCDALEPDAHFLPLIDGEVGGNGEPVDWASLQQLAQEGGKFLLAGGLNSENVESACRVSGVVGVDVSGGVESYPYKDEKKIRSFIKAAKSLHQKEYQE